jgi:hypothetical protein
MAYTDEWKIETVRRYLEERFEGRTVQHYPRGKKSLLFVVLDQGKTSHQLLVMERFFDRFNDGEAVREALEGAEVWQRMLAGGQITVELY